MKQNTSLQAADLGAAFLSVNQAVNIGLVLLAMAFANAAQAGGYVDGKFFLNPAKAVNTGAGVTIAPTFNNQQFNDQMLVGSIHNDPLRTPSTSDPVSTVTGNNYHDETDFVIKGRNELNYAFTRTYNSAPAATKQDKGMGLGWVHSYMVRLKSNDFGACPNCSDPKNNDGWTSSITLTDERGADKTFYADGDSTYRYISGTDPGTYETLQEDWFHSSFAPGWMTVAHRNGAKYVFQKQGQTMSWTPNLVARLAYIYSPQSHPNHRLELEYDNSPWPGRLLRVRDTLGVPGRTGLSFEYHQDGHLSKVSDWSGRAWSFGYDGNRLKTVTNPLNQTTTYNYEGGKPLLTAIVKPLARDGKAVQTQFSYYPNGRTFRQTNGLNEGETLEYDLYRKSTRVTDPRGFVREYHYDSSGRMTKLVQPDGGVLLFDNQADAIRSKKYDALGYATSYSYRLDKDFNGASDAFGNVTREQDAQGHFSDISYGPFDQVASVVSKRGHITTTSFAPLSTDPDGGNCAYPGRPLETRISSLAGEANVPLDRTCWTGSGTVYAKVRKAATAHELNDFYEYEQGGANVRSIRSWSPTAGDLRIHSFTHDSLGRVKTETLRRRASPTDATLIDITTQYEYDALDRLVKTTDPLDNEAIKHFDANGQLWKVTHRYKLAGGGYQERDIVTRTFDAADRVKTETDTEGGVVRYAYDEAGNVIAVTDAENHTTRFEVDPMDRRTAVVDPTGYRTETAYNLRGDVIAVTNANQETVRFEIDELGRRTAMTDAKGYRSEYRYDEAGNLTCTIDANAQAGLQPKNAHGCSEFRVYDELGRVSKIVDALGGETTFTYDWLGNRLSVTDAERKTWRFGYDDLGRLSSETDHLGKVTSYRRDEAGNVFERTNRLGQLTRYSYDRANRLTQADYFDGSRERFEFDAFGNLAAAHNGAVSYGFSWDRLNRLSTKTDSRGRSMQFSYDKAGSLLTKTGYQGSTTHYVHNAAKRLVMLRNPDFTQVDYQYDPAGRLLSRVSASGARSSYESDANGWLTRLTHTNSLDAQIASTQYHRDRVGNIRTQIAQSAHDPGSDGRSDFEVDALYRLRTADHPGSQRDEHFSYDAVGNRRTHTVGSLSPNAATRHYVYTAGSDRLQEIRIGAVDGTEESRFIFNDEGRLTNQFGKGGKSLSWDAKGRLRNLQPGAGGESHAYTYDPSNHRIRRSGGPSGNRDYFLEGEHLESEYRDSQRLLAKYFRGSSVDELVAAWFYPDSLGTSRPYPVLYHHDQVNSVVAMTGLDGRAVQGFGYRSFGELLASPDAGLHKLKYTGREDDGSGLYYYRARYYDPAIGRFVSEDPLGFASGDMSFYVYAGNNPVNGNDPMGLEPKNPYLSRREADIVAGKYVAARQVAIGPEFGVYSYERDGRFYHTPYVSSGYINAVNSDAWGALLPTLPAGSINAVQVHSHPSVNGASEVDKNGVKVPGSYGIIGRPDGSVIQYSNTLVFDARTGILGPQIVEQIISPSGLLPAVPLYNDISASDVVKIPSYGDSTANHQRHGTPSAAGGFLLYPNKPNNNSVRSAYGK